MDVAGLIHQYGYFAVAAGTFLEGETVLFMAGAAANRGHLDFATVVVIGTLAGFAGDQLYFALGRRFGSAILDRYPSMRPRAARVQCLLERYHLPLILSIRFLYGLRIAGPIAIGMSSVTWVRFFFLNLLGALVWAIAISGAGYGLGHVLRTAFSGFDSDEAWTLAVVVGSVLLAVLLARRSRQSLQ